MYRHNVEKNRHSFGNNLKANNQDQTRCGLKTQVLKRFQHHTGSRLTFRDHVSLTLTNNVPQNRCAHRTKYNIYRNIHNSMGSSCTQGHLKNNKIKTTDCLNTDQPIKTLRKTIYKRHMCRSETPPIAVITQTFYKRKIRTARRILQPTIQTPVALHVS